MTNSVLHSKKRIAACFMLLFAFCAHAQDAESRIIEQDKVVDIPKSAHDPKKAALYSAILPGLGQAYNKKYWKIPIVYAGIGISAYFIVWNTEQYNIYKDAFDLRQDGGIDDFDGVYSDQNLITLQNAYRNQRDLSVIITALFYGLNIIDATIDAHLYDFDVSDDLSMRIEPAIIRSPMYGISGSNFGMRLTLKF